MQYKSEESILKIIKYAPPIFIFTLSVLITIFLFIENKASFKKEKQSIEQAHINENKLFIKSNVRRVYDYINNQYALTETKLKESIKNRVYEAHAIATRIYNENKDTKNKNQIKKMIQDALVDIRFNDKRGYFYIYAFDYTCILLPIARHLEGKSFYDFKEGGGNYLTREIIEQVKKETEGFKTWYYHKPKDMKKQYPKIGFNKYFEPFDWFIGTGEYIDDFENSIKKDVLKYINNVNFENNGYIFAFDQEGTYLSYFDKDIIGKNIIDIADSVNVNQVFQDIKNTTKEGKEGYVSYFHKDKPNANNPSEKISFVKGVNYWNWIIGSGFYKDDVNKKILQLKYNLDKEFERTIKNLILISLCLTIVLLIISFYISNIFNKRFLRYKKEIQLHLKENEKQQNILAQQSKMAAMGEMIGNIAHQWRQPLSAITTASTGMKFQKDMGVLKDEDFDKSVECINQSAQHLSKTIDDFRNFFQTNKEEVLFDIKDAMDKTHKLLEAQFKNKDIQIIQKIENIEISNLENELIQVLLNIFNNSRDQLLLENPDKRLIFVEVKKHKEKAIISIKDNAGGFKEEILPRIFEPYFTTKQKSQGTGIGLYMSQEIITKHMRGEIKASNTIINYEDKVYKGAKIKITLDIIT